MAARPWQSQKGVQQESVTVSHAQRPPSADAADLNGSAMPPTPTTTTTTTTTANDVDNGGDDGDDGAGKFFGI